MEESVHVIAFDEERDEEFQLNLPDGLERKGLTCYFPIYSSIILQLQHAMRFEDVRVCSVMEKESTKGVTK